MTLTPAAATHVAGFLANRGKGDGVRVAVKTSGCSGLAYVLEFVDGADSADQVFESHGVKIYVDPKSLVTGMVVLRVMTFSTKPPIVSKPSDNGITSNNNISESGLLPTKTSA